MRELFADPDALDSWARDWRSRLAQEPVGAAERRERMRAVNPAYIPRTSRVHPAYIPRNHRVQQAIDAATEEADLQPLERLLTVVSRPYDDHPGLGEYANPPAPDEEIRQTFWGT